MSLSSVADATLAFSAFFDDRYKKKTPTSASSEDGSYVVVVARLVSNIDNLPVTIAFRKQEAELGRCVVFFLLDRSCSYRYRHDC